MEANHLYYLLYSDHIGRRPFSGPCNETAGGARSTWPNSGAPSEGCTAVIPAVTIPWISAAAAAAPAFADEGEDIADVAAPKWAAVPTNLTDAEAELEKEETAQRRAH